MKFCVLLIGIGRYIELIDDLIASHYGKIESDSVQFILFTDDTSRKFHSESFFSVTKFHWDNQGWPMNTLLRYRMFNSIIKHLNKIEFDSILFMNANLRLISNNLYNAIESKPFFFVGHPGYEGIRKYKPRNYEYNKKSMANISINNFFSGKYVQGTLWGGRKEDFFIALKWLHESTEYDLSIKLIAKVHDESYLNAYLINVCKSYYILDSSFTWPEGWGTNKQINIMAIDKNKIFGEKFMLKLKT
jgi:hypothetical protein